MDKQSYQLYILSNIGKFEIKVLMQIILKSCYDNLSDFVFVNYLCTENKGKFLLTLSLLPSQFTNHLKQKPLAILMSF